MQACVCVWGRGGGGGWCFCCCCCCCVCVCVCACVHVCVCVHVCACACVCVRARVRARLRLHARVCQCAWKRMPCLHTNIPTYPVLLRCITHSLAPCSRSTPTAPRSPNEPGRETTQAQVRLRPSLTLGASPRPKRQRSGTAGLGEALLPTTHARTLLPHHRHLSQPAGGARGRVGPGRSVPASWPGPGPGAEPGQRPHRAHGEEATSLRRHGPFPGSPLSFFLFFFSQSHAAGRVGVRPICSGIQVQRGRGKPFGEEPWVSAQLRVWTPPGATRRWET